MRRIVLLAALAVIPVFGLACGDDDEDEPEARAPGAFFGWALNTEAPTAVAIDTEEGEGGTRTIRAYVCDGFGPPQGKAVWFVGEVDTERANELGEGVTLTSAGGDETLQIDHFDDNVVRGSFTDADGAKSQFAATPATAGAGIYDVSLSEDLKYTGTSTEGDKLEAQAERDGGVSGQITTADDEEISFRIQTLSLAPPAELEESGLSDEYPRDRERSLQPGEYVAVVAPGGTHWLGRSGNVRGGSSGNNIIGLDKAC